MLHQRQFLAGVMAATIGLSVVSASAQAGERTLEAKKQGRLSVEQRRIEERKRLETDRKWVLTHIINEERSAPGEFDRSIITDNVTSRSGLSSSQTDPPWPPGFDIGFTFWDMQANSTQGINVARTPSGNWLHFTWMSQQTFPENPDSEYRFLTYEALDPVTLDFNTGTGYNGGNVTSSGQRGGYGSIDVNVNNEAFVGFHMRETDALDPFTPWVARFPSTPLATATFAQLEGYDGSCGEALWPRLTADRSNQVIHTIAHSNVNDCPTHKLWYWRYNPVLGTWQGPVNLDDTEEISYVLAVDATSDKVAVAVHTMVGGISNVAFIETASDGLNWLNGTEIPPLKTVITNYNDPQGQQAWVHLTSTYDNSGTLHIMWDEQRFPNSGQSAIKHWNSSRNTIRTAAISYWDNPALNGIMSLNFSKLSMGIGDGSTLCQGGAESNNNYVYAVYTQFGGPTLEEQEDHSALSTWRTGGYMNGELYLTGSTSGGNTWSHPTNLTNTKSPACAPTVPDPCCHWIGPENICSSEHWATLGRVVRDIDILFIVDWDAGSAPHGEGQWEYSPVHYLRLSGGTTDAEFVCPDFAPRFETAITFDPECEYHATRYGHDEATLSVMNLGNADLELDLSVVDFDGAPTLTITSPGPHTILAGDPDLNMTVTMTANLAPEGVYTGAIVISHNDTTRPSPDTLDITFFIFDQFYCVDDFPRIVTGATAANGPGSLQLGFGPDGRVAAQIPERGLWRHSDSSSSIFDGSLLIAHGAQDPDTTVFLRYYDRPTNGQYGIVPQSEFAYDVSAQGTGAGCATAGVRMSTRDSVVGISAEWIYPQDYDLDEFVIARYHFFRHNPAVPVTDLAIGVLIDFDVLPASRLGSVQSDAANTPGSDLLRNLVWIGGTDTAGHVPSGQNTATRFRAGVIFPDGLEGAIAGNSASDIQPGGGPTDGFLYQQLQGLTGVDLYTVSDTDLYVLATLARGRSIAEGETLSVTVIFVSDTISETSLKATTDLALANYLTICQPCFCLCLHDPNCDGVISDVLDVVGVIDIAFRGAPSATDEFCPIQRSDVDADGATAITDVVRVINVAFRGLSVASQYVDPCAP